MRPTILAMALALAVALPSLALAQRNGDGFQRPPIDGLALSIDPAGPFALNAGDSAQGTLHLQNEGNATLVLNVTGAGFGGFGGGFRNGGGNFPRNDSNQSGSFPRQPRGPPPVNVTMEQAQVTLAPGAAATDAFTLTVDPSAQAGARNFTILVIEDGTNHTSLARGEVDVRDASQSAQASGDAAPAAPSVPNKVPMPSVALVAGAIALAAVGVRRRSR